MNASPSDKTLNSSSAGFSNAQVITRMLLMTWRYRWGCIRMLLLNVAFLLFGLAGLGFMGTGVDYLRYVTGTAHTVSQAGGEDVASHATPKPGGAREHAPITVKAPRWPLDIRPPQAWSPMQVLLALGAAILLVALIRAGLNIVNVIVTQKFIQGRIVVDLRAMVYEKMQRLSFRFFDANASGTIINRVTGDVQGVRMFIDGVVVQVIMIVLSLTMYLTYMVRIHPWLTVACLVTTPLLWALTVRFSRTVRPKYRENRKIFDRLILALSENIQGMHVVKGFAREREQIESFSRLNASYRDQQSWIFKKVSVFQPLIGFLTQCNLVVMLGYGGYLVVRYDQAPDAAAAAAVGLSLGQLLVFSGLLQQFSGQVGAISNIANSIQQSLIAAQRVFEVIDAKAEIVSPPNPVPLGRCRGEIVFDRVNFAYNTDEPVLQNLSFTVKPGTCAAIVGPTGSGKSTVLSLIPRFYDPQSGRIMIDGTELPRLRVSELRRAIGIVFQESFLFSNTVAANIAFGHPDATREQIEKAAKIAAAHEFIVDMPQGYDTVLQEGGSNLSGGQRQRLAIARALLLEPPILLLDDPLASVDPETEGEILTALESAMKGRTSIVVAHRISTLQRADAVIVLNRGHMVEKGTHEELMKLQGHYSQAARLQAADSESLQILGEEGGPM